MKAERGEEVTETDNYKQENEAIASKGRDETDDDKRGKRRNAGEEKSQTDKSGECETR